MEPPLTRAFDGDLVDLISGRASDRAASPYLLDARSSRQVTYGQLSEVTRTLGGRLAAEGLPAGSRIGLVLADPLQFSTWFLAGLAYGLWVAPLDPTLAADKLLQHDARAHALGLSAVVSDRTAPVGATLRWIDVAAHPDAVASPLVDGTESGGVLLSSSGTTGTPKVMALPRTQLLANAYLIARHHDLTPADRGFNPLPLWHVNAEVVGLLGSLAAGSSLVLDDRFHRTGFWKIVEDLGVTWVNAVPAIISRLSGLRDGEEVPSRIRFVRSASAPLSPTLCTDFEAATGVEVIESYGMTEAASQICANPLGGLRKPGSAGVAVGVSLRIVPLDDASEVPRPIGHIEIKGPTVITSYESSDYADRFDSEGWLRTGDLGFLDDDGYLFIVGRSDDVINRGGEKIYPLEIENVLARVEGVATVVVIGEADEVFGQVPVAYVRPSDVAVLDDVARRQDLTTRLRGCVIDSFARTARPVAIKLVEEFPSHATGKIRRGLLRQGEIVVRHVERL